MRLHTNVLLSISEYCTRTASPPQFVGLLYGDSDRATESYELDSLDELRKEVHSGERLSLLQTVSPGISAIGLAAVGHGLDPGPVAQLLGGSSCDYLLLIELPKHDPPACKAFEARHRSADTGTIWEPSELQLVSDEATSVAISDALKAQGSADSAYAKRILRDRIVELHNRLAETRDEAEKKSIIMRFGQLKKTVFGGSTEALEPQLNEPLNEQNIALELLAQVVRKSDERHAKAAAASENGSIATSRRMYM